MGPLAGIAAGFFFGAVLLYLGYRAFPHLFEPHRLFLDQLRVWVPSIGAGLALATMLIWLGWWGLVGLVVPLAVGFWYWQEFKNLSTRSAHPLEGKIRGFLTRGRDSTSNEISALLDAGDALEQAPVDEAVAVLQAARLERFLKHVHREVVLPGTASATARLRMLQAEVYVHILEREGIPFTLPNSTTGDPEVDAVMRLARARRALRKIPTELVLDDLKQSREILKALNELGDEDEKLQARIERYQRLGARRKERGRSEKGRARSIYEQAARGERIKREALRLAQENWGDEEGYDNVVDRIQDMLAEDDE